MSHSWRWILPALGLLALLVIACKKSEEALPPSRAPVTEPTKKAPAKRCDQSASGTAKLVAAEQVPHPDYPTPRLARTEKIFLLEEPDRGPLVSTATLPADDGMRFTQHAHCELEADSVQCGPVLAEVAPGAVHWRLGVSKGRPALAQERVGGRVIRSLIIRRAGAHPQQVVELDHRGGVTWSRHFDASGAKYGARTQNGANALTGCGQVALQRDARGRVRERSCLQWGGDPMVDVRGVARTRLVRDRWGLVSQRLHVDHQGLPAERHDGVHRTVFRRDAAGRPLERSTFDTDGLPARDGEDGCMVLRWRYDRRGLVDEKSCLDGSEKAQADQEGFCRRVQERDGRGCLVTERRFSVDTRGGCLARAGSRVYSVNESCEVMTETCLDRTGARTVCGVHNVAEYRYERDEHGRITSTKHFGVDQKEAVNPGCGSFEARYRHDARGNVTLETHHGNGGQPIVCEGTGYHGVQRFWDDAGRDTHLRFIDTKGSPATNLGCALRVRRYDNYDHLVESENLGADGKPMSLLGQTYQKFIYDEGHRLFGMLLLDAQKNPARYAGCFTKRTCPKGTWHAVRLVRNASGGVTQNMYFDHNKQLIQTFACATNRCWK